MTIHIKDDSVWKDVIDPSVKVGDVWKNCEKKWARVDGVWKIVYEEAGGPWTVDATGQYCFDTGTSDPNEATDATLLSGQPDPTSQEVSHGGTCYITAPANDYFALSAWWILDGSTWVSVGSSNPITITTVTEDRTYLAWYVPSCG